MGNVSFFSQVTPTTYSVLALLAVVVIAVVRAWPAIMAKVNEAKRDTVTEKAGDWTRLREEIARLDARIDKQQIRIEEQQIEIDACHDEKGEWMTRAIRAEALVQAKGEIRQRAAAVVASDRLARKEEEKDGK